MRVLAKGAAIAAILAIAGQASAAVTAAAGLTPSVRAGAKTGGKSHLAGGAPIVALALGAGVVAGGVYIATKHDHHHTVSP